MDATIPAERSARLDLPPTHPPTRGDTTRFLLVIVVALLILASLFTICRMLGITLNP